MSARSRCTRESRPSGHDSTRLVAWQAGVKIVSAQCNETWRRDGFVDLLILERNVIDGLSLYIQSPPRSTTSTMETWHWRCVPDPDKRQTRTILAQLKGEGRVSSGWQRASHSARIYRERDGIWDALLDGEVLVAGFANAVAIESTSVLHTCASLITDLGSCSVAVFSSIKVIDNQIGFSGAEPLTRPKHRRPRPPQQSLGRLHPRRHSNSSSASALEQGMTHDGKRKNVLLETLENPTATDLHPDHVRIQTGSRPSSTGGRVLLQSQTELAAGHHMIRRRGFEGWDLTRTNQRAQQGWQRKLIWASSWPPANAFAEGLQVLRPTR